MSDAKPVPSKIIPNTFQTPNLLTDEGLLALLTGSETKCYLVVIRKTFGWRKEKDRIAKSQIMSITGLGESTVDDCMISLVKFGLVIRLSENNAANEGVEWSPQMDDSLIDLVGLQSRKEKEKTSNSKRTVNARLARGGDVGHPPHVGQPLPGDVGQPPQQPITASTSIVINAGDIFKGYEAEFGGLTPMIRDLINDTIDTYPLEWIPEAMQIAVGKNIRTWDYVEGILKKCKAKNVRPLLSKLEVTNGNTGRNSGKTTTGKAGARARRKADGKTGDAEYSERDHAAAELINKSMGVQ